MAILTPPRIRVALDRESTTRISSSQWSKSPEAPNTIALMEQKQTPDRRPIGKCDGIRHGLRPQSMRDRLLARAFRLGRFRVRTRVDPRPPTGRLRYRLDRSRNRYRAWATGAEPTGGTGGDAPGPRGPEGRNRARCRPPHARVSPVPGGGRGGFRARQGARRRRCPSASPPTSGEARRVKGPDQPGGSRWKPH